MISVQLNSKYSFTDLRAVVPVAEYGIVKAYGGRDNENLRILKFGTVRSLVVAISF
jgi:hypothetical protein